MTAFRGTPPHHGAGEMAARTQALRPALGLTAEEVAQVRRFRKQGLQPAQIATSTGLALDLIERACFAIEPAGKIRLQGQHLDRLSVVKGRGRRLCIKGRTKRVFLQAILADPEASCIFRHCPSVRG